MNLEKLLQKGVNEEWKASAESGSANEKWTKLGQRNRSYPTSKYQTKLIDFLKKKKIKYELFKPSLDGCEHGSGARPHKPGA